MMLCCLLCCLPPRPVAMPNMGPKLPWAVAVRCAASPHANSLDRGHRQTPQRIRGGHDPSRGDGERPPFVPRGAWLPAEGEVTVEEADEAWEDRQRAREEDTPAGRLSTTGSGTATVVILKRSACRYTASHVYWAGERASGDCAGNRQDAQGARGGPAQAAGDEDPPDDKKWTGVLA